MKKNLKIIRFFLPAILAILLCINLFWTKSYIPGFDTPFYLTEIRQFYRELPNLLVYPYFDRYLTIAFPGILSRIFGFDPVTSYRLAISMIYAVISFVLYHLFKNIFKKESTAIVLSSAIIVSPFLLTYSSMLFANFTSFLVMFSFFAIETGRDFKYKNILLGLIFGLIFYTHNFSTISLGLIIVTFYFLKTIFTKNVKILIDGLVVFVIASVVGFLSLSRYFGVDLSTLGNLAISGMSNNSSQVVVPTQPVVLGNEAQRIFDSLKEHSGKFWFYFFPVFFAISSFLARRDLIKNKKNFILPLAIFIPSLVLSFQPLFHLNFLPERFVSLVVLSSYFFYVAIITLPYFKKYLIPLAVLPLFLNYLASDSLILNKGYRSFTDEEINIYRDIKPLIKKDGVILISSGHEYWGRYFLDGFQVAAGDYFISCGTVTTPGYFGEANFILAKLLGENDPQRGTALVLRLKSLYPGKQLYILTDTNLGCGHGKILQNITNVRQLLHQNNWYLYETI